jgi:hypothetical protein
MESLVFACRYCPKIKYNFTSGKELTSASEECPVPLTTKVGKTVPDIKTCGQHSTDRQSESVLLSYKHSNSDNCDDYENTDKKSNTSNSSNQFHSLYNKTGLSLWSSGQSSWLPI